MYVRQVQAAVIEYLCNPEQPWDESDRVIDRAFSRLPRSVRTIIWDGVEHDAWDLNRLIIETRKLRALSPQHGDSINRGIMVLIEAIKTKISIIEFIHIIDGVGTPPDLVNLIIDGAQKFNLPFLNLCMQSWS